MTKLTTAIINSSNGLNSGTYVVEDTISLSQDLTIPEGVTLIFQGGKFETNVGSGVTISGSNTRLDAPICTIFGKDINVKGSWDIDRAYPQWFEVEKKIDSFYCYEKKFQENGETIFKILTESASYDDWSIPINNAIKMKQVGEVFLINGEYSIASPLHINKGIQFIGENSQPMNNECEGCTRIFPVAEGSNLFNDTYMVYVNSYVTKETDTTTNEVKEIEHAIDTYLDQSTIIKNICFTDFIKKSEFQKFTQKCILAGGGVHFDRIIWHNFQQGVKYTETYNDTRSITNCSFKTNTTINSSLESYAFDMGFLGDAFKFEHNAVHSTFNGKALRLSNCGGASIQGNIINSDILIESCKAVVFNANHCEGGVQIEIVNSCVTTNNNYFHRGERHNYWIHNSEHGDKSVISMQNDMFIQLKNTINNSYDIKLDANTILKISNTYRYDATTLGLGKMYSIGISIQKADGNSLDQFNNFSYIASGCSEIKSNYNVYFNHVVKNTNAPCFENAQRTGLDWCADNGYFKYHYQIIWDSTRNIVKSSLSTNMLQSLYTIQWYDGNINFTNTRYLDNNGLGALLVLHNDFSDNCCNVRFFRECFSDENGQNRLNLKYVDIPVCGTQFLYDNGISICGYKWKEDTDSEQFSKNTSDKNIEMFKICDGNVECYTKQENSFSLGSGWKRGDVIHNIGNNPSTYIVPDNLN